MLLRRSSDEVNSGLLFKLDSGDSAKNPLGLGGEGRFRQGDPRLGWGWMAAEGDSDSDSVLCFCFLPEM